MQNSISDGISVIVPVYNVENYLEACISSIINQTYTKLEIILVNDGSTDGSLDICKRYQDLDPRIKIVNQENLGLIAARKSGLEAAQYSLIGFVDSDDWIEYNMYEMLMNKMHEYNCDLITSGIIHNYELNGDYVEILDCYDEGLYENLDENIYPTMLWNEESQEFGLYCNLVNKLFKKSILKDVLENIDTRVFYGEDALVFYSYMMRCESVYILKKSYYHYRIRNNSMCGSADERLIMNSYYLYKGLEKAFIHNEKNKYILLKQLRNYILQVEAHVLRKMYDINTNRIVNQSKYYDDLAGKRIVLYGAGDYGKIIYQYLKRNVECKIVAWADGYPEGKDESCCHDIISPDKIKNIEYDCVLIAVKDELIAESIKRALMEKYQIPENLILWIENNIESIFKDVYLI